MVMPPVACLGTPLTCDGNTAIFLAAPFKLVLSIKQRKKNGQKENKIKEIFLEQLSRLSLTLQSFIKEGGLELDPVVVDRGKQM